MHLWIIIELKKSWAITEFQSFCLVFQAYHSKDMESEQQRELDISVCKQ